MSIKYDETKDSSYNYEVGYLEGLRAAHLLVQGLLARPQNEIMVAIGELVTDQKEIIMEEFPEEE
tara:strand:+ start:1886 stop:2080 length:195 start_codon:yes stop_codon:yes gene_type:complete